MEETRMSMAEPGRAKGGNWAVTMTAATLSVFICLNTSAGMPMPIRLIMLMMACLVNTDFLMSSPVPLRPMTKP